MERDLWILMQSVSPDQAAIWIAEKLDAIRDTEFRALYLEYDAAFDWLPDDPRLEALADRTARWLASRRGSRTPGHDCGRGVVTRVGSPLGTCRAAALTGPRAEAGYVRDNVLMRAMASARRPATVFFVVNVLLFPITLIGYVIWLTR